MSEKYYTDYPKKPLGGFNPYYACEHCGKSDPQINGKLENHGEGCQYVIEKITKPFVLSKKHLYMHGMGLWDEIKEFRRQHPERGENFVMWEFEDCQDEFPELYQTLIKNHIDIGEEIQINWWW